MMFTLVFGGAGEDVRDALRDEALLLDLRSEMSVPAADGGCLGIGAWMPSCLGCREKALLGVDEPEGEGLLVM